MCVDPMTTDQALVAYLYSLYQEELDEESADEEELEEDEKVWESEMANNAVEASKGMQEDIQLFKEEIEQLLDCAPEFLRRMDLDSPGIVVNAGGTRYECGLGSIEGAEDDDHKEVNLIEREEEFHFPTMPKGEIVEENADHPVMSGIMSQEAWDKVKKGNKKNLTPGEEDTFETWQRHYQSLQPKRQKAKKDFKALRDWVVSQMEETREYMVTPTVTQTINAEIDFGIQCLLLSLLPSLTIRASWMSHENWLTNEVGLASHHNIYPIVTTKGQLYQLDDLIFNFGYGPNYFNWRAPKPFRLKDTPTTLYLISIDVGRIAGSESAIVWKVGITTKNIVGNRSNARYYGLFADNVKVIRQKKYRDGRDAFMVEQTLIQMSRQDTFHERNRLGQSTYKSRAHEALEDIKAKDRNVLGCSEWIYPCCSYDEVAAIFDRMTSYGQFHGEGNVAYSPFKKDYLRH